MVGDSGERRGLLPRYTLKDGNTFLLADALGDVQGGSDGLFTNDTRMLSQWEMYVGGRRPSLLSAAISRENTLFAAHLTNLPLTAPGELSIPQGVIHMERSRFLWGGRLYERLKLTNFGEHTADVPLKFTFAADFADIFEVQGHERKARGTIAPGVIEERSVQLTYHGLDGVARTTLIEFSRKPESIDAQQAAFRMVLPSGTCEELFVEIGEASQDAPGAQRYGASATSLSASMRDRLQQGACVNTTMRVFNHWLERSRSDLALLTTELASGPYPYAGIPWFATQFGRDAIITALQTLWINPTLAGGVLKFLAETQAQEDSAFRDSQPGKILHEMRRGEMAALHEVPFGRYYGGVDTTPLFVMLAGAYEERTGDRALIDSIWSALLAAIAWIERRMDNSPTGFLDYARAQSSGLLNQGWKDSGDSIFHTDGRFPRGPVAVVEVQGYAYAAFRAMATLAARRTKQTRSVGWLSRAERLRTQIEDAFWIPEMNFYAIALDGEGAPCKVYGSNAGHLLFCGVPSDDRAAAVTTQLLSSRFASGWGVRTLAEGEPRYNPMSYHNGSVWPHDTSICAAGMSRYGRRSAAVKILNEIFETANYFSMRLPELFCGFPRIHGHGPVAYPVACLPQAWASGAAFLLLQASLGIRVDGPHREVHIEQPALPEGVDSLTVRDLPVGAATIDLQFHRIGEDVVIAATRHVEAGVRVMEHL